MKTITKKELFSLIENVSNKEVKEKLKEIANTNEDEIDIQFFFENIKKLDLINDLDYNLLLLLEEFYLRFKDIG